MTTVTEHVGVGDAPPDVLARSSLAGVSYLDHYVLATDAGAWSAEHCARVMFEVVGGAGAQAIWRTLMLRLDPRRSPDRLAGWRIDGGGEGWVRLHAESWWSRGQLIVQNGPDHLALTTVMAYRHPAGHLIWGAASAIHRRLVPGLLETTRKVLARS